MRIRISNCLWAHASACALAACLFTSGCAAEFASVDGYDGEYVDAPPANIEVYPRYQFQDGYVYNVNGRYYHQHSGRWVAYRQPPPHGPEHGHDHDHDHDHR